MIFCGRERELLKLWDNNLLKQKFRRRPFSEMWGGFCGHQECMDGGRESLHLGGGMKPLDRKRMKMKWF